MAEEYLTDDEQWEAVKRWLAENGLWIIAGVVLGAALLFGYRYYESSRNDRALRAAAQFGDMTAALDRDDRTATRQAAAALIKEYPTSPYADQAQLTIARLDVDAGQPAQAVAPLTQVMNGSKDAELKRIARLRLARLLIDQGKPDQALTTLAEDAPGAFVSRFHEVRGDAFYAKKDFKSALDEYKAALAAADSGGAEGAVLELKIADVAPPAVAAAVPPAAAAPAAASTADPSNKAKH